MRKQTPLVLLVDDNPADVELAREALAGGRYQSRIHNEAEGGKALKYLRCTGTDGDLERPDLILLDLNLPGRNGWKVLEELKGDVKLCTIPTVVFSTSQRSQDVLDCYEAGANCYVNKPGNLEEFFLAIQAIEQFWFGFAQLPEESDYGITCERIVD